MSDKDQKNDKNQLNSSSGKEKKEEELKNLQNLLQKINLGSSSSSNLPPHILEALKSGNFKLQHEEEEEKRVHKFWNTQPVPQEALTPDVEVGAIHPDLEQEQIRQTPYPLPKEFEWSVIDLDDKESMEQLYNLLTLNYNEDADQMFRFSYSLDFLAWALRPPNYKKEWNIGVRVAATKKLVAFISAIPINLSIDFKSKEMVEINFLCVHKKLRSKRLAPVLIKEVTRRAHLTNIFQAVYTAGVKLPSPVAVCPYYHRLINYQKLVDIGFTSPSKSVPTSQRIKDTQLPAQPPIPNLQLMVEEDVSQVRELFNKQRLFHCKLTPTFQEDRDCKHWLLPHKDVLWTYLAKNEEGKVTDFVSFYRLDSSVLSNNKEYDTLHAAYLYYYAIDMEFDTKDEKGIEKYSQRLKDLIQSALVFAKQKNFDVFNCLELAESYHFLNDLKFKKGDGNLNYYLFNYLTKPLKPEQVGLMMI